MRFRPNHLSIGKSAVLFLLVSFSAMTVWSQDNEDRWLRVFTDEDSVIEVNRFSLVLESDQVIRADFRTTFVEPVPIMGTQGGIAQSRLDSIQFRLDNKQYRIRESKFVDSSGHLLASNSSVASNVWKSAWGRTGSALFSAATQLRPFGTWKVVSYRYASGDNPSKNDPPELRGLVGFYLYLGVDRVQVDRSTCSYPIFEPAVMKDEEFARRFGSSLASIGMADNSNALNLRCKSGHRRTTSYEPLPPDETPVLRRPTLKRRQPGSRPADSSNQPVVNDYIPMSAKEQVPTNFPTTLLLRQSDSRMLMLWDGVFLELERATNTFHPRSFE